MPLVAGVRLLRRELLTLYPAAVDTIQVRTTLSGGACRAALR